MAESSKTTTKKKKVAKKTAAKKTASAKTGRAASRTPASKRSKVSAKALEENFKPLTKSEIEEFRVQLFTMRAQLLGDVDSMRGGALGDDSSSELSSMPIHMADIGTDNYEQEFTLGLIESDRKMLREIDLAIVRIEQGEYGVCVATGEQIGRARLKAKPYARYCIDFARKLEQGLVKPPSERDEEGDEDQDSND